MRLFKLFLAGVMCVCALGLSSCSSSSADAFTVYVEERANSELYLDSAVSIFEQTYPDTKINVVHFSDEEAYLSRIKGELLSGKGPDVVITYDNMFEDINITMRSGAFAELDGYMEGNEEFGENVLNHTILEAGQYNGKQYVIPLCFTVPLLVTTQENLDSVGFGTEFTDYNGFLDGIEKYYADGNTKRIFNTFDSGFRIMQFSGERLVDYTQNTINTESAAVRRSCDLYCKYYETPEQTNYHSQYSGFEDIVNGYSVMSCFFDTGMLLPVECISRLNKDSTPVVMAVPSVDGGVEAVAKYGAAIRNNSSYKQQAMDFISILLSEDIQNEIAFSYAPVRRTSLISTLSMVRQVYTAGNSYDDVVYRYIDDDMLYYNYTAYHTSKITGCSFNSLSQQVYYAYTDYVSGKSDYDKCTDAFEDSVRLYLSE